MPSTITSAPNPKKHRLGPQNDPGSLEPEKLPKNCQGGKMFFEPEE
jgi:hypothetical protein